MINPIVVHELLQNQTEYPDQLRTDIGRINYFARENNVTLEELAGAIENYIRTYSKNEAGHELDFARLWLDTIKGKALPARDRLVGKLDVLDTKMRGPNNGEYGAYVYRKKGQLIINFIQKLRDDEFGNTTGIPNAEYWGGTPGQYNVSTILGIGQYGDRYSDVVCIDGGSNWNIYGVRALKDELDQKFGDEVREQVESEEGLHHASRVERRFESLEKPRAKKVYENLK
jgi:hypothetical protein